MVMKRQHAAEASEEVSIEEGDEVLRRRLCTCDVEVIEAFVVKSIDERELHVAVYPTRQKLWRFLKCESKLPSLLNYFGQKFCHLLENHLTARERLRA